MPNRNTIQALTIINTTIVLTCLTLGTISCGDSTQADQQRVLATVNGTPISEAQLIERLKYGPGPRRLLRMIDTRLIAAEAAHRKISPGRTRVELKLSQAASRFGSEQELIEMLRRNNASMAELKDRLRLDAMLDEIAMQEITVAEDDIKGYYQKHQEEFSYGQQVQARMILAETRKNAQAIKSALDSGGDFAGLAKALSIDPGTADKGGNMGYFERGDYAEEISEVAFALPPGQTSEIFKTPDGFCILKIEDRRPAATKPLENVRDQITARLKHKQRDEMRKKWLIEERKRASLVISDPRLRELVEGLAEVTLPPDPFEF